MTGLSRRGLITGLIALAAAPAIVRASSLMPVKVMESDPFALLHYRMDEVYRITRDNMARSLYGDGVAATIWYMNEGQSEPIAFNKFFARVEFPNGR